MPFFIYYQGRKQGPLTDGQIVTLLFRGTISEDTEASFNEEDWQPLHSLPGYERLHAQVVERQGKTPPAAPTNVTKTTKNAQPARAKKQPSDTYSLAPITDSKTKPSEAIDLAKIQDSDNYTLAPITDSKTKQSEIIDLAEIQDSGTYTLASITDSKTGDTSIRAGEKQVQTPPVVTPAATPVDPFGTDPFAALNTVTNDPFASAGFNFDDFTQKIDATQWQSPASTSNSGTAPSLSGNHQMLYIIGGSVIGLLVLILLVVLFKSGSAVPSDKQSPQTEEMAMAEENTVPKLQEIETTTDVPGVAAITVPEPQETETKTDVTNVAAMTVPETQETETKTENVAVNKEQPQNKPEEQTDESLPQQKLENNLANAASALDAVFPIKSLAVSAVGSISMPQSENKNVATIFPFKEQFLLKYVSYIPQRSFSALNISPQEIAIIFEKEKVYRLFLDENGLHGEWVVSPVMTIDSYQILNGLALAEVEVIRTDTLQVLKTISLFEPLAKKERFSMSAQQILLDEINLDFVTLGVDENYLRITKIKNLHLPDQRKQVNDDTLRYFFRDDGKDCEVDIRAIAKTPLKSSDGRWRIPIVTDAEFTPTAEELGRVSQIKTFLGRNIDAAKSLARNRTDQYGRVLTVAEEIGASAGVTLSVLDDIDREFRAKSTTLKQRNASAYRQYTEIVTNYRERLNKAKRMIMAESIAFEIMLIHPDDPKRMFLLVKAGKQNGHSEEESIANEQTETTNEIPN
ncbi:MAG: hypothetical protein LBQ50_10535 [Planctomycetaceae bacterium]|jgi:hypothetical protein|nr:hypothetical protein [Planctomycetaceae bacterium]